MKKQEIFEMTIEDYNKMREVLENLEYEDKNNKKERKSLLATINKLTNMKDNAKIIEYNSKNTTVVEIGDEVTCLYHSNNEEITIKLVVVNGKPLKGTVSVISSLGLAVYKEELGNEVTCKTEDGVETITITDIKKAKTIQEEKEAQEQQQNEIVAPTKILGGRK